jgi:hypothetical protein
MDASQLQLAEDDVRPPSERFTAWLHIPEAASANLDQNLDQVPQ